MDFNTISIIFLNQTSTVLKIKSKESDFPYDSLYFFENTLEGRNKLNNFFHDETNKYYQAIITLWGDQIVFQNENL